MLILKPFVRELAVLSMGVSCLASSSLFAARPINLSKEAFPSIPSSHALATSSANSMAILSSHTDEDQITHARIQQLYAGQPVWGADAGVHAPKTVNRMLFTTNSAPLNTLNQPTVIKNGIFYADLEKDLGRGLPKNAVNEDTKKRVLDFYKSVFVKQIAQKIWLYSHEEVQSIVFIDAQNKAHWAYLVSFLATNANQQIQKNPHAIIDAENNKIYKEYDDIKTLDNGIEPVEAVGYGGNPLLGKLTYGKDKPVLPIHRIAAKNQCLLKNKDVEVIGLTAEESLSTLSFPCVKTTTGLYYQIPAQLGLSEFNHGAYSPPIDALYDGMVIKQLYQDWYHTPVLVQKDKKTPLLLSMNMLYFDDAQYSANAFWNSQTQQMYFGFGDKDYYPFVSLSVAAHEISHGFTDQHAKLIYADQSGALNESYSDMASAAASYYASNETETEWTLGGEIIKQNLGKDKKDWVAIRYFNQPTKDNRSIDHVNQYSALEKSCAQSSYGSGLKFQSCMVHFASGVFNKAFYHLATTPGWNTKSAFAVMMKANRDYYWTSNATFKTAACAVKEVAASTVKDKPVAEVIKDVSQAFNKVGIALNDC